MLMFSFDQQVRYSFMVVRTKNCMFESLSFLCSFLFSYPLQSPTYAIILWPLFFPASSKIRLFFLVSSLRTFRFMPLFTRAFSCLSLASLWSPSFVSWRIAPATFSLYRSPQPLFPGDRFFFLVLTFFFAVSLFFRSRTPPLYLQTPGLWIRLCLVWAWFSSTGLTLCPHELSSPFPPIHLAWFFHPGRPVLLFDRALCSSFLVCLSHPYFSILKLAPPSNTFPLPPYDWIFLGLLLFSQTALVSVFFVRHDRTTHLIFPPPPFCS